MRRLIALLASAATLGGALVLVPAVARAAPAANADKRALIIGVSNYQAPTVRTLGGAGDAAATRDLLVKSGWPASQVRTLIDGEATAANIRAGFQWLASSSSPSSFSVFHYSGHTKQKQLPPGQADGEDFHEFMWSVDNQWISDNELAAAMNQLQGKLWVDMAACEAAGFDNGISGPNRLFTAASQENEKAYEMADGGRSVFNQLMVSSLSGGASIQQAEATAARVAPGLTAGQQPYGPQHPVIAGGDGSDWFVKPPAAPAGPLDSLTAVLSGLLGPLVPQTPGR